MVLKLLGFFNSFCLGVVSSCFVPNNHCRGQSTLSGVVNSVEEFKTHFWGPGQSPMDSAPSFEQYPDRNIIPMPFQIFSTHFMKIGIEGVVLDPLTFGASGPWPDGSLMAHFAWWSP